MQNNNNRNDWSDLNNERNKTRNEQANAKNRNEKSNANQKANQTQNQRARSEQKGQARHENCANQCTDRRYDF